MNARFHLVHRTRYTYASPAAESFMEARLTPVSDGIQTLVSRQLVLDPPADVHTYTDYFGNSVEAFAIPHRHNALSLESTCEVETRPASVPQPALDITVSEARQIFRSETLRLFDYLRESEAITFTPAIYKLANRTFRPGRALGESLLDLLGWIHREFTYRPGSTTIETTPDQCLARREGVCQDFAQLMIAVLRSAELPARYVCGYIETDSQRRASEAGGPPLDVLVGASESHAWVEAGLPGGHWLPLDPTNNCVAAERHVTVARGRDYLDTAPTRGVFKGSSSQALGVVVQMRRIVPQQPATTA